MTNELDKTTGTKEKQGLTAGSVMVQDIIVQEHSTKKGGKVKITAFICKHPDREEPVSISNMKIKKIQGNNETIMQDAVWYREDEDGLIEKGCNTQKILAYYGKKTLRDVIGTFLTTELNADGYLAIKAY